jgi:hypothetical protein
LNRFAGKGKPKNGRNRRKTPENLSRRPFFHVSAEEQAGTVVSATALRLVATNMPGWSWW